MKSAACPFRYLLHRRQGAKSLRLDGEDRIELAAEVLQSNDGGELHQFFFRKMALETVEEPIRNSLVRVRHSFTILALVFREEKKSGSWSNLLTRLRPFLPTRRF